MKSTKIDKLRYEDYDGTAKTLGLFLFLETLNIKSATEAADEFSGIIDEEFCDRCKSAKDYCECGHYDGDRAYDAWKDAQLENED